MSFTLEKTTSFGVMASYWQVINFRANLLTGDIFAEIGLFMDSSSAVSGNQPLETVQVKIPPGVNTSLGNAAKSFVESWAIENEPTFQGAVVNA